MKNQLYLSLFLICLISCLAYIKTTKSNTEVKSNLRSLTNQIEDNFKKTLFDAAPQNCKSPEDLEREKEQSLLNDNKEIKQYLRAKKSDLWWVKSWGYGESAYFYDFLEPVFLSKFVAEAKALYDAIKVFDANKDGNYEDPLDYNRFFTKEMSDAEKTKIKNNLALINENYVKEIYDASINAVQLHKAMKVWKWYTQRTTADYAMDFVKKYDADGDGRLNLREITLGAIDYNRKYLGNPSVKLVFNDCATQLSAMFSFFDCDGDGFVSAEDIWTKVRDLKRGDGETRYNIFSTNQDLRIRSINDFMLKCHGAKNGLLNKTEFTACVLLGFWNRQTEKTKVLTDGTRSMIGLRWSSNGQTDIAASKAK